LCFFNGSKLHLILAKRLLAKFPTLIYDFFIGDDYYGQNVLHMAIVNEDPYMVRYLLSLGADLHARCTGKFFCADDQKEKRKYSISSELPYLSKKTDYRGLSYFGELPLSFACVLKQVECVRILIAYGADVNKQDSNGNTALHMLVINNNMVSNSITY
jgi:ankyrin repeat protein